MIGSSAELSGFGAGEDPLLGEVDALVAELPVHDSDLLPLARSVPDSRVLVAPRQATRVEGPFKLHLAAEELI